MKKQAGIRMFLLRLYYIPNEWINTQSQMKKRMRSIIPPVNSKSLMRILLFHA